MQNSEDSGTKLPEIRDQLRSRTTERDDEIENSNREQRSRTAIENSGDYARDSTQEMKKLSSKQEQTQSL